MKVGKRVADLLVSSPDNIVSLKEPSVPLCNPLSGFHYDDIMVKIVEPNYCTREQELCF